MNETITSPIHIHSDKIVAEVKKKIFTTNDDRHMKG